MTLPRLDDPVRPDEGLLWRWVWASVRPVLGYVLVAFGMILLLTAYLGVSREVLVAKQLPYLVSGGLFGLAFVTLGSRLLVVEEVRRDRARVERLERAVLDLHAVLLTRADAPDPSAERPDGNGHAHPDRLLALTGGQSFHRQDCPMVQGKSNAQALTADLALQRGLRACRMCQPLVLGS